MALRESKKSDSSGNIWTIVSAKNHPQCCTKNKNHLDFGLSIRVSKLTGNVFCVNCSTRKDTDILVSLASFSMISRIILQACEQPSLDE